VAGQTELKSCELYNKEGGSIVAKPSKTTTVKSKQFDFILAITVLIMLALGLVMVLSASSPSALAKTDSSYTYLIRQAQSAGVRFSTYVYTIKGRL